MSGGFTNHSQVKQTLAFFPGRCWGFIQKHAPLNPVSISFLSDAGLVLA